MSIESFTLNALGEDRWDSFIETRPAASIYHHSLWHRVIEATYGFKPLYHARMGRGGEIASAIPSVAVRGLTGARRKVSYPFSDYCDPLVEDPSELRDYMEEFASRGFKRIELRSLSSPPLESFTESRDYVNFTIGLDAGEKVYRRFHRDCVQRAITRAARRGVEVSEGWSDGGLKAFYGLHLKTRKRQGVPVQPFRFFRNIRDLLGQKGMAQLMLAHRKGTVLAAFIIFRFRGTVYYKFGASDPVYMNHGVNQLLMWEALRKAIKNGCGLFDLGRTFVGNKGLMDYKRRWGAQPAQLRYLYSRGPEKLKREGGKITLFVSSVLRKMPDFSNRCIGSLFYKYLA